MLANTWIIVSAAIGGKAPVEIVREIAQKIARQNEMEMAGEMICA